ncbi:MAG: nucleotidyl transferase AbiEii/AbiGii toxin family protein [Streptococcaceae bacterium]|jgi:hypothetical protein|nr:nucleotidyl transferase AbiEii/AbiGii toxin family protein [Streptococcaceae bacterium]
MKNFLKLSSNQRKQVINATATNKLIDPFMIEKDYWVVFFIDLLFNKTNLGKYFAFKGGTSLSKAYGAINRFSEDIDLVLDWRVIGFSRDEPWKERSKNQQNRFNEEANLLAHRFIKNKVLPELQQVIEDFDVSGVKLTIRENEPETIEISYPQLFANHYSLQTIRLEIGPLASWTPTVSKNIDSYIVQEFPQIFVDEKISVPTVEAKRTFWEKVVILHREANRGKSSLSYRYSRHYSDVFMLSQTKIKEEALNDLQLLADVVAFNQQFYPINSAKFDEAVPGTIKLMPTSEQLLGLRKDYDDMSEMFFGTPIPFDLMMVGIKELEEEIHQMV